MSTQPQRFLGLPFFLALLGIFFSVWNLWGDSSSFCVTEGCNLFQDFSLAGISMWWIGLGGFVLLLFAAAPGFSGVGFFLAGMGLILDSFLLVIMLLTAPCLHCLIIGALLALSFMAYRSAWRETRRNRGSAPTSVILLVWTLLLLFNLGALINSETSSWALPGQTAADDAPVQVYFSPSCSACLDMVNASSARGESVAWYPVMEESRDLWVISATKRRMAAGEPLQPALAGALAETPANPDQREGLKPGMLWMQYRLWRNRAHVLKAGSDRLPYVEFRGVPSFMLRDNAEAAPRGGVPGSLDPSVPADNSAALPWLNVDRFCNDSADPCEPEASSGSLREVMGGTAAP